MAERRAETMVVPTVELTADKRVVRWVASLG